MKQRLLSLKLSGAYIAIYGILACFYPFLTYYFQTRGLSYTEMGIGFALVSLTSVAMQPLWGIIADKYSNKRTVLLLTMFLCSLAVYSLVFASGFYLVMGSIFLVIVFQSALTPVADAYCYALIKAYRGLQYGKIRLMGSLGYALVALFLGWTVKYFGINSSYVVYSLSCFLGIGFVLSISFRDTSMRRKVHAADIMQLLNKKVILLLLAVVFTNISISSNSSYIAILIEKTGGEATELGMVWFLVAISELPAFYYGAKLLKKYGELNLFILGLLFFVLRYILLSFCTWYIPVLVIQLMQGVTYTFFLIASLEYLNRVAPAGVKTVAMTLHAASIAVGGIIGNLGGGVLLEYISIFMFYKVLACTCILGIGTLVVLKKVDIAPR
ncbi:MAG: MFS transporter [Pelosinus sp.]|nr:MFS transporter [Pelosinus sp.]